MKKLLILLNVGVVVPCAFFGFLGTKYFFPYIILTFVLSVVNFCFSKTKKDLSLYNLILLLFSVVGINLQGQCYFYSLIDKQIWYNLEGSLTYQLETYVQIIFSILFMGIEIIIKHFQAKKT